jgi:hypothetical protein
MKEMRARMKDEGGRMKEKPMPMNARDVWEWRLEKFILHPSPFILRKSAGLPTFLLPPSSLILQQSAGLR